MNKMNIEVMEQLLKDLAANVGYDLIPAPFDTPFEEASIEGLPDSKQFFWPVPASVLNDKEHEEFRKMCVEADIIDTVCTTSLPWPSDENDHVAILLIDVTRRRRGCIKFVDSSAWDISDETDMAAVCNMLVHDLFPGEDLLAFQMNEDAMDEGLDYRWNEQVRLVSACKVRDSLLPRNYLLIPVAKQGFKYVRLDEVFHIEDLEGAKTCKTLCNKMPDIDFEELNGFKFIDDLMELNVPAIVISACGNLQPQKVVPENTPAVIDMNEKIVLIPQSYLMKKPLDLDYCVEQLKKEMTLRQLPFLPYPDARLIEEDLMGVQIEIPEN